MMLHEPLYELHNKLMFCKFIVPLLLNNLFLIFIPFSPNLVANLTPISSISPPRVTYLDPPHTPRPLAATVRI